MNHKTPEQVGISSADIQRYVDYLEEFRLSTHSVIIARGDDIVLEKYWEPFGPEYLHRQYSASKSIVAIAVGFAIQDGYFTLDDKMIDLFPKELENQPEPYIRNQTVRNMLMMSTSHIDQGWFKGHTTTDRVQHYFDCHSMCEPRPGGSNFLYDSEGSFVLGALVERKTGKSLIDYLKEKLFPKIGVSDKAYFLKCPGGHSWGDSAMVCRSMDMLLMGRFMLNGGKWNGEQLLDEKYVRDATSKLTDNNFTNKISCESFGYGYLIWQTYDNSWMFYGMGGQFVVGIPDKDIVMVHNADDQGNSGAMDTIVRAFFELVVRNVKDEPLPENPEALKKLKERLPLMTAKGEMTSSFAEKINGVTYALEENKMGISKLAIHLSGDEGEMRYTNAQGDKVIRFGFGKNVFEDRFPQEGYSDKVGGVDTKDFYYKYAASAAWVDEWQLHLKVQIIDTYFGRLDIRLSYNDQGEISVRMTKTAEDFLNEYTGWARGAAQ